MRGVVWLILLAVVAVVAAATLGSDPGLVTIYWGGWRTDLSLNLFILLLLATCFAIVAVIQGVQALVSLPQRAREWRIAQRERSAQAALREALALSFGGRYARALKSARRALEVQSETPTIAADVEFTRLAHLLAAGSLHRLQDRTARDDHLQRVFGTGGGGESESSNANEGARLLAAEWSLDDRNADRALALLAELPAGVARRTQALRLKLQAHRLSRQPLEALRTARLLAKHQAFSSAAALSLLRSLAVEALEAARDGDQLRRAWNAFDGADRRDPLIAARAAVRMTALGNADEARGWLRPLWERLGDFSVEERAALARALVIARAGIGVDWLPLVESALGSHPRDAAIAYAAGAVFAERQLWGKATLLLEPAAADDSLDRSMRRTAWRLLADIAEVQGQNERAAACFREASRVE